MVDKLWSTIIAFAGCDCRHGFPIGDNFVGEPARQPCRFSAPTLPSRHYLAGLNLGLNIIASEYVSDGYIDIYGYLAHPRDGNLLLSLFACPLLLGWFVLAFSF